MQPATYKHTKEHGAIEDAAGPEAQSDRADHNPSAIDQVVIRKEMSECVNEFIENLTPDYRTVIVLSELEGLTNMEIAEILYISLDNAKIRLHRARSKLKAVLREGCIFYCNEESTLACDRKQVHILPKAPK